MPSNHTKNYNLNQWAKSDRVKMEDFNADNAKIDAALKAEADARAAVKAAVNSEVSARQALATELRPKAGAQLIASYTPPENLPSAYTFSPNIDWDEWLLVFVTVELVVSGGSYSDINFYINDTRAGSLSSNNISKPKEERAAQTFMFTPVFDKRNWVRVWPITATTFDASSRMKFHFQDITTFKISSGLDVAAETSCQIWGIR